MNLKTELRQLVLIGLVALVVFANSAGGDFVYDDNRQILRNPLIQDTSQFKKALTSDVWAFKGDGTVAASNYYRPTFVAWLILLFKLFGASPAGWHLANLLLHAGICLLAYLLSRRLGFGPAAAFAVALLFAVHPAHTESVAWISGSPDLLFGVFFLGSLWFAMNHAEKRHDATAQDARRGFALDLAPALVFYAFALGAKEIGLLAFPLFYLIYSRPAPVNGEAPAGKDVVSPADGPVDLRPRSANILPVIPFAVLAAIYFLARWAALGAISLPPDGGGVPLTQTLLTLPSIFVFYLRQILFPLWLGPNYPLRPVETVELLRFGLPLFVALAAAALFALLARRSFAQKFGFALFGLTLLPAMNATAFPVEQLVHDRYLYLPLLGFLWLTIPYFEQLAGKLAPASKNTAPAVIAVLLALPLGWQTFLYNRVWSTDFSLWSEAVTVDPQSAFNWLQYAAALSEKGRIDEAVAAYNNSIDIRPTPLAFYGKARNLLAQNKSDEAVYDIRTVIELPNEQVNAYTLYQAYELLAMALSQQQKYEEAELYLFQARRRLPIYFAALTEKLAVVMYQKGAKSNALRELEAARSQARTEFLPESKTVLLRLGMLYGELNRKDEARGALQEYLRLTDQIQDTTTLGDRRQALALLKSLQ
ncbi:MAG: hypothetical protein JSS81_01385 [Acidobacteria bacterium]|nr:hypothetical protein [Acidobacteriota bacterium]